MRIPISEVPLEIRRKAARHLETVRDTEIGVGAEKAKLADAVCPIYRPDLEEIAYYEFEADPLGFIIVSAGDHDYPIGHWSFNREPVSRQLEAAAEEVGKQVARVFKLDALAYVAEDESGEMAAKTGQIPAPIEGLPADLEQARGQISMSIGKPEQPIEDDTDAGEVQRVVERSGPPPPELSLREVENWAELREVYGTAFALFLEDLRQRAARVWEIDKLISEFGEGILVGRPLRVALLEPDADVDLSGEAADMVKLEWLERPDGPSALELAAVEDIELDREYNLELNIAYPSGLTETLSFFVVSPDTPSTYKEEK
jgi:hypothetical protein